ncbi:MAG: hypothetical protein HOH95_03690 [Dehalococcoidia bacterium]|jgi:hypothetical protein|nr:hypothetical protein [Dehalococcoidia bacterium]
MTAPADVSSLPIPESFEVVHEQARGRFVSAGSFLDGATRRAIVEEARAARECGLCARRSEALSAASVDGEHSTVTELKPGLVELAHGVVTDSGRLTQAWFGGVIASGVTREQYVEAAGLLGSSTIADTFAVALTGEPAVLDASVDGEPSGVSNAALVDVGAYVGLMDHEHPHPKFAGRPAPNICRALAMVPSAVDEFWDLFMPHYQPMAEADGHEVGRSQIEFVAARTSALNECFY